MKKISILNIDVVPDKKFYVVGIDNNEAYLTSYICTSILCVKGVVCAFVAVPEDGSTMTDFNEIEFPIENCTGDFQKALKMFADLVAEKDGEK